MLVVKRVVRSWKDEAVLRLRHKSFQQVSPSEVERKSFQRRVISLKIEKRFRRFPLTFSSSSSSLKKVFNVSSFWTSKKVFDVVFILEVKKRSTLKTLTKKLYQRFHRSTGDQNISEERQSLRRQTFININGVNGTKLLLHVKPHKIVGTICNNNNVFIFEKPKVNCVT